MTQGRQAGLTLLELIVAMAIAAVVSGFAIPAFQQMLAKQRAETSIAIALHMYQMARNHAIHTHEEVHFCGSDSLATCQKHWRKHLILFIDSNGNHQPDAKEIIYSQTLALTKANFITRAALGKPYTILTAAGRAKLPGSLLFCSPQETKKYNRRLTWSRVGRAYLAIDGNRDGRIDDTNGQAIQC